MTNSPLGQYAPLVATVTALVVIGGYVFALLFGAPLGISDNNIGQLQAIALIALGAVFGSAVSVNGWKQPLAAVHKRLDEAGLPPAADATTHAPPPPPAG